MSENVKKKEKVFIRILKFFLPWKGDGVGEVIRKLVLIISLVSIVICGIYFYDRFSQRAEFTEAKKLSALVEDTADREEETEPKDKFKKLLDINSEFVGWLKIDGTGVDVPIVKTDDNETYLRKSFYGEYSVYGNPFLDFRNHPERLFETGSILHGMDRNTIVYGHNMLDKLVFAELLEYKSPDFYKEHPIIDFDTIYGDTKWKIISCYLINSTADMDNGYAIEYNFINCESDEKFLEYIEDIKKRSFINTPVDAQEDDVIITLSTCDKEVIEEGRFVVVARLVREGESPEVDVNQAKANDNIKFPQGYCDKKGIANNYADDAKWTPFSN